VKSIESNVSPEASIRRSYSGGWTSFRVLLWLAGIHLLIASQLWLTVDAWIAMIYLMLPPIASSLVFDAIGSAPLFALFGFTLMLAIIGALWPFARWAIQAAPFPLKTPLAIVCLIWLGMLSGESMRGLWMTWALLEARPHCYETASFAHSLREKIGLGFDRQPHAWMISGGMIRLWSYRSLRFEPAVNWSGSEQALAQCRKGQHGPRSFTL
jgi:hypothetical protein